MRWLAVASVLLYLTRRSHTAVLKCSPESQDPLCASEKRDISTRPSSSPDAECLAGSEWDSNCHSCWCSNSGVAECLKHSFCDRDVNEEPIRCKPLTSFKKDCNICTCLENGLALCTLKGCFSPVAFERRKRQVSQHEDKGKCKPGSTWKESCNSCWCTDSGLSVCTKIGCEGSATKREVPAPARDNQKECEPGTTWKKSCNTCWCSDNGLPLCTKKGCFDSINTRPRVEKRDTSQMESNKSETHVIVKRGVCKPNQEFQIDCNPCKCAPSGQSYTCEHSECLEGDSTNKEVEVFMESEGGDHIERHSVCKPRDTFYVGCNTCHCNSYGTDYSCTNKPCPLPEDVEIFHELKAINTTKSSNNTKRVVCVANRMFIMDCNTCWCNEDGTSFFCTRRICTPDSTDENNTEDPEVENKLRVIRKECRPNEVFELDCNMCRCSGDGKSFSCTRRACVDFEEKNTTLTRKARATQQEAAKACQPGSEFRMDCNKCLCNSDGLDFSCTRNDCSTNNGNGGIASFPARSKRDLTETVQQQCVPGSVFDKECNVCRCTEDGLHAVCSIKRCKQDANEVETESTPSFRCTPGDQFKRDCKDCTCSADGKNVFCTIRFCEEDLNNINNGQ